MVECSIVSSSGNGEIPTGGYSPRILFRFSCLIHTLCVDNVLYHGKHTRSASFLACFAKKLADEL
jgi:hypothetical protein